MPYTNGTAARKWADAFVIVPQYGPYPYSGLQVFGFAILGFFPTLSLVVCGLRVLSRRLLGGFALGKSQLWRPLNPSNCKILANPWEKTTGSCLVFGKNILSGFQGHMEALGC